MASAWQRKWHGLCLRPFSPELSPFAHSRESQAQHRGLIWLVFLGNCSSVAERANQKTKNSLEAIAGGREHGLWLKPRSPVHHWQDRCLGALCDHTGPTQTSTICLLKPRLPPSWAFVSYFYSGRHIFSSSLRDPTGQVQMHLPSLLELPMSLQNHFPSVMTSGNPFNSQRCCNLNNKICGLLIYHMIS